MKLHPTEPWRLVRIDAYDLDLDHELDAGEIVVAIEYSDTNEAYRVRLSTRDGGYKVIWLDRTERVNVTPESANKVIRRDARVDEVPPAVADFVTDHRVAVQSRFLGPTDTKGARVKVTRCDRTPEGLPVQSLTVSWDHSLSTSDNHTAAIKAFVDQLGWDGTWVTGGTVDGLVAVRLPEEVGR